ncbi:MAG: GAF domain-containing protein [Candidatus Woesearchaeota archaeon]|nr:GAF domain-containing protein [Candidatus Woesearchaeota archaeon]
MITADPTPDEERRLSTLHALKILETPQEHRFDSITRLAAHILNVPIVAISFVDEHEQFFKSIYGLNVRRTSREVSFCAHAILEDGPFIVNNALKDERFRDNPLVLHDPKIRFYAGIPIAATNGCKLGTLCSIDRKPRRFSDEQLSMLQDLAMWAELQLHAIETSDALLRYRIRERRMKNAMEKLFLAIENSNGSSAKAAANSLNELFH